MPRGISRADANRMLRQEALREQLSAQGHEQHIVEISDIFRDLTRELDSSDIQRLLAASENHRAMLSKYLPDLKQSDSTITMDARITDATDAELDARLAQALAAREEGGSS